MGHVLKRCRTTALNEAPYLYLLGFKFIQTSSWININDQPIKLLSKISVPCTFLALSIMNYFQPCNCFSSEQTLQITVNLTLFPYWDKLHTIVETFGKKGIPCELYLLRKCYSVEENTRKLLPRSLYPLGLTDT